MATLADRNNNPGNLRDFNTGEFRKFNSPQEGFAALMNDLQTKIDGKSTTGITGQSTLADFAKIYAPQSDNNNPAQYTANLANKLGIRPDTRLEELRPNIGKFAEAIANNEGYSGVLPNLQPQKTTTVLSPAISNQQQQVETLGQQLSGRLGDISKAATQTISSQINPISGAIQIAGGAAGAFNDVLTKAIEKTPIVGGLIKGLEDIIGQGVGSLAKTRTGTAIVKEVQNFSEKHPELAKDIGAGFNIATAIPILKGLGAVKNIAMDGIASALQRVAEKGAIKDLTEVASRTIGGRKIVADVPEAVQTMVEKRALPEVSGGRYDTKNAHEILGEAITAIEDGELQPALQKASTSQLSQRLPLRVYEEEALNIAKDELKDTGPIKKYFAKIRSKYGDMPTIEQMNEAKRIVAKNISEAGFNSPTYTTDGIVRKALQTGVEDGAKALGLEDVEAINQKMAPLIKTQKLLKYIDGKTVKNTGLVHGLIQNAATIGGEVAGGAINVPFAGALVGRQAGGLLEKQLGKLAPRAIRESVLRRTGQNAIRQGIGEASKKVGGLIGASLINRTNRP